MPALTTVHDMNYHFWALVKIGQNKNEPVSISSLVPFLDHRITEFQKKYKLQTTRFTSVKQTILNNILRELRDLGYLNLDDELIRLTERGQLLQERLLTEKSRLPIYEMVIPDLLAVYDEVLVFLDYFLNKSNEFFIPEPRSAADYYNTDNALTDIIFNQITGLNSKFQNQIVPEDIDLLRERFLTGRNRQLQTTNPKSYGQYTKTIV